MQYVLDKVFEAVIIHHCRVLKYCGSKNQVSSVIIEREENAKIVDVNHPLVPLFKLLILWSKRIEDNWGVSSKLT